MFRYDRGHVVAFGFFILCFVSGILIFNSESVVSSRLPAAVNDYSEMDFARATPAALPSESRDSKPNQGRSYFDKVFSENGLYKVPYPFTQVIARLSEYTGQKRGAVDSTGLKIAIFPMGRSLQRSAAIVGINPVTSLDPYFIFPRVVVGVDEEPTYENSLILNLKNRMYLGFNEKAQVIEAISYNEEMGRYEYQIVKNYASGKKPQVVYANRSLCLSCHQNLSPIFSRGPWSESNANPVIADRLQIALDQAYGKANCSSAKNQSYCYQNGNAFYFGAPVRIDSNVTRQLDTSVDLANLSHAYQKTWRQICPSFECKSAMLQAMILYRLTGQVGIVPSEDLKSQLTQMEDLWKTQFPWGLSIPSPDIPDRDPLKDGDNATHFSDLTTVSEENREAVQAMLSNSKIPAAFEPLQLRAPIDIWKGTGFDSGTNTNRMVRGLAQDFTSSDLKLLDQWLIANRQEKDLLTTLKAKCKIDKDKTNFIVSCLAQNDESFKLDAYLTMDTLGKGKAAIHDFTFQSRVLGCDSVAAKTEKNILSGLSCAQFSNLDAVVSKFASKKLFLKIQNKAGVGLRTYGGFDISEMTLDLDALWADVKVYNQTEFISQAIKKNQVVLFSSRGFNRFQVMKTLLSQSQIRPSRQQDEFYNHLPLHFDGNFAAEELSDQMNGFTLLKTVCAQCHQSNGSTPPNFMGSLARPLNEFEQCRRIEQCAPRMIYRLKMRECDLNSRKTKKNPMPPETFFKDELASAQWLNSHQPKVLKFLSSLVDSSEPGLRELLESRCPSLNSNEYEQLKKCEFNKLKAMTRCR